MYKDFLKVIFRDARPKHSSDHEEENAYLSALVEPVHYAKAAGVAFPTGEEAVRHFFEKGLEEGLSPSNFFSLPEGLRGRGLREYLLAARADGPDSGWFDCRYYAASNPDVAQSGMRLFEHYARWGVFENRRANPIFDSAWYDGNYEWRREGAELPPFRRFFTYGDERGQAPARWLLPLFDHRTVASGSVLDRLGRLTRAIKPLQDRLGSEGFEFLAGLFYSYAYDGGGMLGPNVDGVERFVHFLTKGLVRGFDPGPLFENALYEEGASIPIEGGERLVHFIQKGMKDEAPTRLYDDATYRAASFDLRDPNFWAFRHFVMHGLFEGRRTGTPRAYLAELSDDGARQALRNWQRFWEQRRPEKVFGAVPESVRRGETRLAEMIASPMFRQSVSRACALEPSLSNVQDCPLALPPVYDIREAARVALMGRFPRLSYDAVVCAPFLRIGGADLVACLLAEALSNDPERRVLLLRTDHDSFERPDWVPETVDTVDVSDVLRKLPHPQAEEYFYSLLLGLSPKQVFNVNSNLCWRTFARYGARLSRRLDLYAYLFCWDRDTQGNRVGYPSDFYASTAAHLSGIFTDTEYLRSELINLNRPPADVARRLLPLFSPIREVPKDVTTSASVAAEKWRPRPRVLWAGRLDRQKRFDLAVEIARAMPEADFVCWGVAGIDAVGSVGELPDNLTLNPAFKSYEELPLADADAWLFTSGWEGMPTLIIELAVRGVPIVASAVGGVPEMIDETTGYPVAEDADVETYVATLREALSNPAERVVRAGRLQARALERHSREAYVARLEQILRKEA